MKKVSIIIPTYNRPNYLRRILDYYNSYKTDYKIIIADSSSIENKALNKETISSFPNLKILYLDVYSDKINPLYKLVDAIKHTKGKYCLFCADDDFITPNGINQSVDFLENNQDFTIVHGHYISFYSKNKEKGEKKFCWRLGDAVKQITFPDARSRLIEYLSDYSISTFYGVHRTDSLKMVLEEALKFTNDERFSEFLISILPLIYGKMKCLDVLYAARETIFSSAGITNKTINDFIKEGSYEGKYANFKNCLAIHLNKNSQLTIEESQKIIDEAMAIYLKKSRPNDYKYFLINILYYFPEAISKKIKLIYRRAKLNFSKPTGNFLNFINDPSSKYYDDFNRIRGCLMSHTEIYGK